MPRPPKVNSKTLQIVLVPKLGQDEQIKAFRELHARNGLSMSDTLFKCVEAFLKEHHWPPGQSQTQLIYADKPKMLPLYKTCVKSDSRLYRGMFYCRLVGDYRLPVACTRCDRYVEG